MTKSKRRIALGILLLAALCAVLIALPVFATNDDYGVSGDGSGANATLNAMSSAAPPSPTGIDLVSTNTPVPTNTPAPTSTPTCTDGQWGQESNGAWVCISYEQMTQEAQGA